MWKYSTGPRSRRNQQKRRNQYILSISGLLLLISMVLFLIIFAVKNSANQNITGPSNTDTEQSFETENITIPAPEKIVPVSSATVSVTGDILTHIPILNAAYNSATSTYNFDDIFTYTSPYITAADYAIANLEVTLRGTDDGFKYSGYPRFNCPDAIADSLKSAGFDMCLTANNHCFDTGRTGLMRTLRILSNKGLNSIGTMYTADAPKYFVKEINDIKIGMVCYTFETGDAYPDRPSINGILTSEDSIGQINSFDYNQLDKFYAEMETNISNMKNEGAQAILLYIHWGNEYQLSPTQTQKNIAQKMCDLGVDVIVGGHPHVIQPMELLESTTDITHKTICLYSTGNAVSNQRRSLMPLQTGHTEDGILLSLTFTKYSNGSVSLENVSALPTWVNLHKENGKNVYSILPLDKSVADWKTAFQLNETSYNYAQASYQRTMALIGEGLQKSQEFLDSEKSIRQELFDKEYQNAMVEYQSLTN